MSDKKPLNIYIEPVTGGVFNTEIGWLSLPKASKLKVSIKDYKDKSKILEEKQQKEKDDHYNAYIAKWNKVDDEEKGSKEFVDNSFSRYSKGEISASTHQANIDARSKGNKERNARKEALTNNYKKENKEILAKHKKELDDLKKEYASVRWVWQLIGSDRPQLTKESFNEGIVSGKPELSLDFDDFLEGGGATYLEPFWEETAPTGKYPNGVIINAKGVRPQILQADWRDADDNLITETVKFGSTVFLNIYTEALYGHNVKIQLLDKDKVIRVLSLGLTNADDKLFAAEYPDSNIKVEDREEKDIKKKENQFIRAVSVHKTLNAPAGVKSGMLVDEGESNKDKKVDHVPNVQKCKFAVFVDPLWEMVAGKDLVIYAEIENALIPNGIKKLPDVLLKVNKNGKMIGENISTSNQVAVVSEVETDMAFFHHCKYTYIEASYNNNLTRIFDVNDPNKRFVKNIKYSIVANSAEKILFISIPDLKTEDCIYENDPKKTHEKHAYFLQNEESFKSLDKSKNNEVSFGISYPKPSISEGEKMMNEDNIVPLKYDLKLASCAVSHPIQVLVYPDVYYEIGFKFMTENPFYKGQTKAYTKRKYLGKWGFFDKRTNENVRKEQRSQRKQNYKNEKQEVAEGRLKYDQFEFFLEYGYNDIKESNLTLTGEHPIFDVINSMMWIINTIGKLSFDKEADEAKAENDKKRPDQVKKRNKKRNAYLAGKNKTLSKIPFKIEIEQPTFAGSVKWHYEASEKNAGELGTLYEINFKADPLISVKGSLDLLFVATKIPYVGQAIQAITAVADTVGSADDFWNTIVEFFGGGDEYKIQLDIDYYLDLFVSGEFKIEATAFGFHTIDRFRKGEIKPEAEIKFGIECGGSLKAKFGNIYSLEAEFEGSAYAVWKIVLAENNTLKIDYQGLYATIKTSVKTDSDNLNNNAEDNDSEPPEKKFLLHDGFSYEFKLD